MKRALTMLLVVALVGSLLFAGFAGTAAAHSDDKNDDNDDKHHDDHDDKHHDDNDADDRNDGDKANDKDDNGDDRNGDNGADDRNGDDNDGNDGNAQEAGQATSIEQKSSAEVTQVQESYQANVNEGDGTAVALSYKGTAAASNDVTQSNVNVQAASATSFNVADVTQDIEQDDD